VILLPGSYSSSTNPQLLHDLLSSSSAKLASSPGFNNATTVSLPLNVGLQAGIASYSQAGYSGTAAFTAVPTNSTGNSTAPTALGAGSVALAPNVWAAMSVGSSNARVVLWDSLPDVAQLPASVSGALALLGVQGASCSPVCAGAGVCTPAGTCACPPGFNGTACESCSPGFFGPHCAPCPANCTTCADGVGGSGICLKPEVAHLPSACNCLNGQCEPDGSCACNAGWTKAANGTACAQCAPGFFQTSTGDCKGECIGRDCRAGR
jgi:hypothetical protein